MLGFGVWGFRVLGFKVLGFRASGFRVMENQMDTIGMIL